ncbi:hypothetical protein BDR03DRAFT_57448 [Suillus americanus]|nr:hypothetical protein BDR03DRAFT_57448 [Suillus americanus]
MQMVPFLPASLYPSAIGVFLDCAGCGAAIPLLICPSDLNGKLGQADGKDASNIYIMYNSLTRKFLPGLPYCSKTYCASAGSHSVQDLIHYLVNVFILAISCSSMQISAKSPRHSVRGKSAPPVAMISDHVPAKHNPETLMKCMRHWQWQQRTNHCYCYI